MQYNFDRIIDRRGFSKKWDQPNFTLPAGVEPIPMWIADMDFATPDCVLDALHKRIQQPTFGYFSPGQEYYDAIIHWRKTRFGIQDLTADCIRDENTTVGAAVTAMLLSTQPGDGILVNAPNYNGFTAAIKNAQRRLVKSPLVQDEDGVWRMDFADMERCIQTEKIRCFLFCSPHNPTGRVWTKPELLQLAELCSRYQVLVVADEIWSDFVFKPLEHLSFSQVSDYAHEHSVSVYGPSKTFNLAGLRCGYSVIYNKQLGKEYAQISQMSHYNLPNTFTVEATIAAYRQGADYADQLLSYIRANMVYAKQYIDQQLPMLRCTLPQATYTLWVQFYSTGRSDEENIQRMVNQGVLVNPASDYNGSGYFRMNVACPRSQLQKALDALKRAMV